MSRIAVTLLVASLAACGRNRFEQEVETETRSVSLVREMQRGAYEVLDTAELKALLDKKTPLVLVDTMPFADSYQKSHIPGAKHFEFPIPELALWDASKTGGKSQAQFAELLGPDKGALLVFYCGFVQCTRSHNAAMWAKRLGYQNVKRHPGGIFAWKGKGYPTESGDAESAPLGACQPMFDPIQQRILGVLIEKEVTVPDSYPLTDNSLLIGCNQKNNRDPEMALGLEDLAEPLRALQRDGWVSRIEQLTGYRTIRWRHHVESQLGLDRRAVAVLCELFLRGPQAPGALKPRVARLGFDASPEAIAAVLAEMSRRQPPLVEELPLAPRERDRRWGHLLGPRPAGEAPRSEPAATAPAAARPPAPTPTPATESLADRVTRLEAEVRELRARLDARASAPRAEA